MDYQLSIITPNGKIFEESISALQAPGVAGGFGILGGHVPMVAALQKGVLKLTQAGQELFFGISAGILEVNHEHNVLILSDSVVESKNLEDAILHAKTIENN